MSKKSQKLLTSILAAVLCAGMLTTAASAASTSFTDVPAGSWFYEAVTACAGKGYVAGVGNSQFMPEGKLTYAQVVTMLANAFFQDEKQDYENDRQEEMDAYFNGDPQWWSYNAYYFMDNGLLEGSAVSIRSSASVNAPITRYDVVQVASNILNYKGVTVSETQKSEAQAQISDWSSVPGHYQDAVSSCYSLGIISGYTGNRFGGTDTLTRAQACVILNALEKVVESGGSVVTPPTEEKPEQPVTPSAQEIEVTTKTTDYGTGYYVKDNGFGDGYLNNGKPITEENVLELLAEAEKIWPTGMIWTYSGTYNNNWYEWSGPTVDRTIGKYANTNYGCGGFAAMVSDYVFGQNSNPFHRIYDETDLRPSDIVITLIDGKADHVAFIAEANNGAVCVGDGNVTAIVRWSDGDPVKLSETDALWSYLNPGHTRTYEFWSRYPA